MCFVRTLMDIFLNPDVWLPPNVTWTDLEPNDKITYVDRRHLVIPLLIGIVLLCVRFVLERYVFVAVGISLRINNTKPKQAAPNDILERAYLSKTKLNHKQIVGLAKQLDWSERQVERWLRVRLSQDRSTPLNKFCEACYRGLYYTTVFLYGVFCLWDKPWLWDIRHCWYDYPHQSITSDCWWYCSISMAFYWSLTITQFSDAKGKDFWMMFVHHFATLGLMAFAWVLQLHRLGTLLLLVHDSAEGFDEAAKMAKYSNYIRTRDVLFLVFTVVWTVSRIVVFPVWIIYSTYTDGPIYMAAIPAYILNFLLIVLLVLHVIWTYMILKVVFKFMVVGKMEGETLSCSSDDVSDESDDHDDASPLSQNNVNIHRN